MRHIVIILAALLTACTHPPRTPESLLPPAVGAWHRTSLQSVAPSLPKAVRTYEATYEGAGKITVTVHEMKAGVAFETAQQWRPVAETVSFDKGPYFVLVKWDGVERAALKAFVRDLEKTIGQPDQH